MARERGLGRQRKRKGQKLRARGAASRVHGRGRGGGGREAPVQGLLGIHEVEEEFAQVDAHDSGVEQHSALERLRGV